MAASALDDPRNRPGYREAFAGLDQMWRTRRNDYFVDIADDGYVIASGPDIDDDEAAAVRGACSSEDWHRGKATNCLGECEAGGCPCTRARNPVARESFLRTASQRVAEVAEGSGEVCYASLGCGFLRFDFCFLERVLALGVPVTAVHLVDSSYDPDAEHHAAHRVALAQFSAWFADRSIDVYAHASVEKFGFRVRQAQALPVAVLQIDCSELTWVFDSEVKPMLEEVLQYGGLFCSLTAREGASSATARAVTGANDAWGEIWRLSPESGRIKLISKLRYRPGEGEKQLGEDEPLPPAVSH